MISSTSPSGYLPPPAPAAGSRPGPSGPGPGNDSFQPSQTALLSAALNHTPAVRPEVLAAAVQLATNPSYPPPEVIAHVARLISQSPDPSETGD